MVRPINGFYALHFQRGLNPLNPHDHNHCWQVRHPSRGHTHTDVRILSPIPAGFSCNDVWLCQSAGQIHADHHTTTFEMTPVERLFSYKLTVRFEQGEVLGKKRWVGTIFDFANPLNTDQCFRFLPELQGKCQPLPERLVWDVQYEESLHIERSGDKIATIAGVILLNENLTGRRRLVETSKPVSVSVPVPVPVLVRPSAYVEPLRQERRKRVESRRVVV